jgi:outer membrane protein TolC
VSFSVAATLALTAPPACAQEPTSEIRIRELVRLAAEKVASSQKPDPLKGSQSQAEAASPADTRPVVALTLDDVVKLTLDRNLTIAVQRLNPGQFDPAIASLQSAYWPQATALLGTQSTANPPTNGTIGLPAGTGSVASGVSTFNGGLAQSLPWGGGQLAVALNNLKDTTTSTTALYNPAYLPTYSVSFTQPLARGLSIDPNRQQIIVTKLARDISEVQLKSTIVNTVSNVREAYWNLVYAVQSIEVAQQGLALASQLVRDNQTRMQIGTMTPLDVVTSQSQEAQARLTLVQAMSTRDTAEITLKQQIVSGTQDTNWNARIDPVDRPSFEPVQLNIEESVRRALAERTDLLQAKKNLEQNDVTNKFLRNQLLPQADVVLSYGLQGLGGTQLVRANNNAIDSALVSTVPGGYGSALGTLFTNQYPTWSVQLRFSQPIGHVSVGNTSMAAAKIQLEQTALQVKQIELQVATEITDAVVTVRNDQQTVETAQIAQDLAQKSYDAEVQKLKVGLSTNYNVIQQLNLLNAAKNSDLQAVLNYRNALVELDRAQQTTLNTANITLLGPASWGNGAAAVGNLSGAPVGSAR